MQVCLRTFTSMCFLSPDIYLSQSQADHGALNNAWGAIEDGREEKRNENFKETFLSLLALPLTNTTISTSTNEVFNEVT